MSENPKIIIKKVHASHEDHDEHGGAWKVAYADFMTAMMAFFLLLWLLSLSEEDKLTGIAEYFSPTEVSLTSYGGQDILDGQIMDEVVQEGLVDPDEQAEEIVRPVPGEAVVDPEDESVPGQNGALNPWSELTKKEDTVRPGSVEEAMQVLEKLLAEDGALHDLSNNVLVRSDGDSLLIEIVEVDGSPLFASGKATLTDANMRILSELADVVRNVTEDISITGHTDAAKFRAGAAYTNWELSADRANATRRALSGFGIPDSRIDQVGGVADREPLNIENPAAPENRRVTLLLTAQHKN